MNKTLVDITTFQNETGLDNQTLKELYMLFVEEISEYCNELEEKLLTNKLGEFGQTIHNIKGLASSYRCILVFELVTIINEKCKNKDFTNIIELTLQLQYHIKDAVVVIKNYFM